MIRFTDVQDRILDNVQARIKPVVTQPSEAVLAAVVTKPVETIVPKSKRPKPGRYRDREAPRLSTRLHGEAPRQRSKCGTDCGTTLRGAYLTPAKCCAKRRLFGAYGWQRTGWI
jgi:hypothetical protein